MKGLLWLLSLFALAVGVSLAAHFNDGYLLLVIPPYRIELSLSLAILLVLGGFLTFYALLRMILLTRALPQRVRAFRERRKRERIVEVLYAAARLFFEGRYGEAMSKAGEAHAAGQLPALAALLAARSAQRLGDHARQKEWLEQAIQADPTMQAASLMLAVEMLIDRREYEAALTEVKRLQDVTGRHIAALRLELFAQQGCGHWDEVLRIARLLEKNEALPPENAQAIKLKAHQENLRAFSADPAQVLAYQNKIPPSERSTPLALTYAEILIGLGAHDAARDFIEAQLNAEWDSRLVALYGKPRGGDDLTSRIARVDHWLLLHPDDFQVQFALGRMCLEQRLWSKAQSALEAALALCDQREIRLELARLFELTERSDEAMLHYRAAAQRYD